MLIERIHRLRRKYYNVTILPLETAIELAIKENMERDNRQGLLSLYELVNISIEKLIIIYKKIATDLLTKSGENYLPEYTDHHHVIVQKTIAEKNYLKYIYAKSPNHV